MGILLKLLAMLFLPVPLFLWPLTVAIASILVGLGYGFGQPMVATFEAVGEGRSAKFYHSFVVRTSTCVFIVSIYLSLLLGGHS